MENFASMSQIARALSFSVCAVTGEHEEDEANGTGANLSPQASAVDAPVPSAAPGQSKIQVCLRLRPPTASELAGGDSSCVGERTEKSITFQPPQKEESSAHSSSNRVISETYYFDSVFPEQTTQAALYEGAVDPLVEGLRAGRSALIFAFGITNAGKTHTVHGPPADPGLLPRALAALLNGDRPGDISISYTEIYNEQVYDLLATLPTNRPGSLHNGAVKRPGLQLKEDECGHVFVKGLKQTMVTSLEQAQGLLAQGAAARQVAFTATNSDSSRSHSIVTLRLHNVAAADGDDAELVVVDLAGSERTGRTNNTGARLKESARINSSLMNLGRCLEVLRTNQQTAKPSAKQVVPFRESKITRVLQQPLLAPGTTVVMLCNIYPGERDAEETAHALRYAAMARDVTTGTAVGRGPRGPGLRTTRMNGFGGMGARTVDRRLNNRHAHRPGTLGGLPTLGEETKGNGALEAAAAAAAAAEQRQAEALEEMAEELREELSAEMEATIETMERQYSEKLSREQAIYEQKFEHKLRLLSQFAEGGDPKELLDLFAAGEAVEALRVDNAALRCSLRAAEAAKTEAGAATAAAVEVAVPNGSRAGLEVELAGVRAELAATQAKLAEASEGLEEQQVQQEANLAMEVETLEFQLEQADKEAERAKDETRRMRIQVSDATGRLISTQAAGKAAGEVGKQLAARAEAAEAELTSLRAAVTQLKEVPTTTVLLAPGLASHAPRGATATVAEAQRSPTLVQSPSIAERKAEEPCQRPQRSAPANDGAVTAAAPVDAMASVNVVDGDEQPRQPENCEQFDPGKTDGELWEELWADTTESKRTAPVNASKGKAKHTKEAAAKRVREAEAESGVLLHCDTVDVQMAADGEVYRGVPCHVVRLLSAAKFNSALATDAKRPTRRVLAPLDADVAAIEAAPATKRARKGPVRTVSLAATYAAGTAVEVFFDDGAESGWFAAKVTRVATTRLQVAYEADGAKEFVTAAECAARIRGVGQDETSAALACKAAEPTPIARRTRAGRRVR
jgi:hypothetical protein